MKNKLLLLACAALITACTTPQPRKPVTRKTATFLKESIERNKVINKIEEAAFLEFMEEHNEATYISSDQGFWYFYNLKSSEDTKLPVTGDEVLYDYEIMDINKEVLYTKEELGERSYLVDKQELISGLQDGLKLMKEGEEVTFLFPSHKAYGYAGYQKINSGQPLIYKVRLKKITAKNN